MHNNTVVMDDDSDGNIFVIINLLQYGNQLKRESESKGGEKEIKFFLLFYISMIFQYFNIF